MTDMKPAVPIKKDTDLYPFVSWKEFKSNNLYPPESDPGTLPKLDYGIEGEIAPEGIPRREPSYRFYVTAQPVGNKTFQPSVLISKSPAANKNLGHTYEITGLRLRRRQILQLLAKTAQPVGNRAFQPSSWETESPTVTADIEHPDQSVVLNETLREPDVVVRWKEHHVLFQDNAQANTQDDIEEIKGRYADNVNQILEAKNILCKQDRDCIEFVVVVDHIRRDHSFQLSDIACELDDLYPHWDFGFQYVSLRAAGQLPLDEYSDLINDG